MKPSGFLLATTITLLLYACSPHSGAGVWQATTDNEYGISRLVVAFEGWAEFEATKQGNASWHCFWGRSGKLETTMECTSSNNSKQKQQFTLTINDQGLAELRHNSQLIGLFTRLDKNPTLKK